MFDLKFKAPIVVYLRVSSDKQAENLTIDGQRQAILDFCTRLGFVVAAIYVDDGLNGDLPWRERPGARQLLKDAAEGKVGTVLVYLFDRFARDVLEALIARRELEQCGATPYSISEQFDTETPFGKYMFVQQINNAALWKAQFLEKSKNGSRHKARSGQYLGGICPYGYYVEGQRHTARIAPDNRENIPGVGMTPAGVVAWMYEQIEKHNGNCYSLAALMNAMGIPTKAVLDGRGRLNRTPKNPNDPQLGRWQPATVHNTLTKSLYKGVSTYGKRKGTKNRETDDQTIERPCPALVTAETWETVQRLLHANARFSKRPSDRNYLLRGLIFCEHCNRAYSGMSYQRELADRTNNAQGCCYVCNSSAINPRIYREDATGRCPGRSVTGRLEHVVWSDIASWLREPEKASLAVAERAERSSEDADVLRLDIERLTKAIDGKEGERLEILTLHSRRPLPAKTLDAMLDKIDVEEAALKEERGRVLKRAEAAGGVIAIAANVKSVLTVIAEKIAEAGGDGASLPFATRRETVLQLVERITVRTIEPPGGKSQRNPATAKVTITYRFGTHQDVPQALEL